MDSSKKSLGFSGPVNYQSSFDSPGSSQCNSQALPPPYPSSRAPSAPSLVQNLENLHMSKSDKYLRQSCQQPKPPDSYPYHQKPQKMKPQKPRGLFRSFNHLNVPQSNQKQKAPAKPISSLNLEKSDKPCTDVGSCSPVPFIRRIISPLEMSKSQRKAVDVGGIETNIMNTIIGNSTGFFNSIMMNNNESEGSPSRSVGQIYHIKTGQEAPKPVDDLNNLICVDDGERTNTEQIPKFISKQNEEDLQPVVQSVSQNLPDEATFHYDENSNEGSQDLKNNHSSQLSAFCNQSLSLDDDCEESVDSFNPLANFTTLMAFTDPYIQDELSEVTYHISTLSGVEISDQQSCEIGDFPDYDQLASPITESYCQSVQETENNQWTIPKKLEERESLDVPKAKTKRESMESARSSKPIICRNPKCKKKLKIKDYLKLDITPRMSSGQQEHKPWRLSKHESRALIRPLSPFSSFITRVSKADDKSMPVNDSFKNTKVKECEEELMDKLKSSTRQKTGNRLGRGRKRKTTEAVSQTAKKIETVCAKSLDNGKQMIGHEMEAIENSQCITSKAKTKRISAIQCISSLSKICDGGDM